MVVHTAAAHHAGISAAHNALRNTAGPPAAHGKAAQAAKTVAATAKAAPRPRSMLVEAVKAALREQHGVCVGPKQEEAARAKCGVVCGWLLDVACAGDDDVDAGHLLPRFGAIDEEDSVGSDWPLVPVTPDLTMMVDDDTTTSLYSGDRLPAIFGCFGPSSLPSNANNSTDDFLEFSWDGCL